MEDIYYEDFIKKRELKDRWIQFWARLKAEKIYLYVSRECKEGDFCEIIWLSSCSRCILLKRRNYSFRFRLTTSEGSFYFKCDSNLQRHRWIHMIHLASSGRSPELPPNHINMRCCYQEAEPKEIGNRKSLIKSTDMENNNEERVTETSGKKETIGEELSKRSPSGASIEEMEEMDFGRQTQPSTNKNKGSKGSEESEENTEIKEMMDAAEGRGNESKNDIKEGNPSCQTMVNDKISDSSSIGKESPAQFRQTFSLRTFSFGSLRKSLRRQSYPPKQNKELSSKKAQRNSIPDASYEEKIGAIKYSMDNPAFTDDDTENIKKPDLGNCCQSVRIINVASYNE